MELALIMYLRHNDYNARFIYVDLMIR